MMTLEADSVNVQALDMGHIVVDIDGVNITELINCTAVSSGYMKAGLQRVPSLMRRAGRPSNPAQWQPTRL